MEGGQDCHPGPPGTPDRTRAPSAGSASSLSHPGAAAGTWCRGPRPTDRAAVSRPDCAPRSLGFPICRVGTTTTVRNAVQSA